MKIEQLDIRYSDFASEMTKLCKDKHFDFLVTIVGEDFGEEALGCVYILENTDTHERTSVKCIADKVDEHYLLPTVTNLWMSAELLEREVFDFLLSYVSFFSRFCKTSSSQSLFLLYLLS